MPHCTRYDVIVIGSGPGGEGAAMMAAKAGKRVAVVDDARSIGGGCVHTGTIPSKVLRHAVQQVLEVRQSPLFAKVAGHLAPTFGDLLQTASRVISSQAGMRRGFYKRNNIELVDGYGRFVGDRTLEVRGREGDVLTLQAEHFVVAAGSRPYRPDGVDFMHPRVLDANSVLQLEDTPADLIVYGAGVIGCEYASIFKDLGARLNLVNTRERLLPYLDEEIVDALSYHLRHKGVRIRHGEQFAAVEADEEGVTLHLQSGKRIRGQYLLWTAGRQGNGAGLGLDTVGVEVNQRGNVVVDDDYRTANPAIYAVGDIVGPPGLASASYDQGRFAATHIVEGRCDRQLVDNIPVGIYTAPEISCIGPTERELTAQKIPYEVGHAQFKSLARAQIVDCRVGMLKLLFDPDSLKILAIHCFGHQAAEIVHIGQAIMSQPEPANSLRYFVDTTFNYPTMAEAYRVAALNGLNRLWHRATVPAAKSEGEAA